jgi:hypothetical protein
MLDRRGKLSGSVLLGAQKEAWAYLERGVMVDTDKASLIRYTDNSQDLEIIDPIQTEATWRA